MHIFLDETGSFALGTFPSPSLIGALIVPDSRLRSLEKEYQKVRKTLPKDKGEVKGRLLNEMQVAGLIPLLRHHEVLLELVAIELGAHTEGGLKEHRVESAKALTQNLTDEHTETLKKEVFSLKKQLEELSLPLFVQSHLTFQLIRTVIELAGMYYSQRRPGELGQFNWVVDAKGTLDTPTEWELWWSTIIMGVLQTMTIREPIKAIPVGDYSHMKRFEMEPSPWLRGLIGPRAKDDAPAHDLKAMLTENLRFSSAPEPGLELVDILTNATRRALIGNLKEPGWKDVRTLMIHRKGPHYIHFFSLEQDPVAGRVYPYLDVLHHYGREGKSMLTASNRNKRW